MTPRPLCLAAAAALAFASRAPAQDSVFGIRGLGFPDRSVSAASAGTGGGFALFDGAAVLNPAALSTWHGTAGWAVAAGSNRSFDNGSGSTSLSATRFPVLGVAGQIGPRIVVGVTVADYLDRNWAVSQADTVSPRGTPVAAQDQTTSVGGVSDIRLAMAYRLQAVVLGVGLHALTGSAQTTVIRTFPSDSAFLPFAQHQVTSYRGVGLSLGALATPARSLLFAATVRFNGSLRASSPDSALTVGMPVEASGGVTFQPVQGLLLSGTVGYASWSSASSALASSGEGPARNVWSVGAGVDVTQLHLIGRPLALRLGYRWRQLPFAVDSGPSWLTEHAVAGGIGFEAAGGRATVDVTVEAGSRAARSLSESFVTAYVGLTIRP
ncbi:MAG TPA: hypothetical protein VEH62_05040 [Gemmatimonadales bacterium]|nr:hypothetical protein [Gemmatimonadales bacterium]